MSDKKLFLLDAYALVYRAYYAFIKNPRVNSKGLNTSAIFGFINTLEDVMRKENPSHLAVVFDPSGPTFRHEMYEQYKAQRQQTPEDIKLAIPIIKEIIECYNIPVIEVAGYEADDVIGTLAIKAEEKGYQVYMMTPDKDYGQLVSENRFIYRPRHNSSEFKIMGIEDVLEKFKIKNVCQVIDMLGLMGDKSDNIPGCPGVGEVTAQKLIEEFGSIENLLENTDKLKGAIKNKIEDNQEIIRFSKFLATIKTDVPIEFKEEEYKVREINEEKIKTIFEELEFRTLINRVLKKETKPLSYPKKQNPLQRSLFDDVEEEKAEEEKITGENNFSHLDDIKTLKPAYYLIDTEEKIDELITKLNQQTSVAFDTETTSTSPMESELVGMSFSYKEKEAYYIPVPKEKEEIVKITDKFKSFFANEKIEKIGQNIKFDALVLKNYGIEIKGKYFDTMIAHYLLQPELNHGMDYLAEIYLNYQTIYIEELIGPRGKNQLTMRDVPLEQIVDYAAEDADVTLRLKKVLEKELVKNDLTYLFENIEMPLIKVLIDLEWEGVKIDIEALRVSSQILTKELLQIEEEIFEMSGMKFNVNSSKQIGEVLFDRLKIHDNPKKTKTGQYATSEEILISLKGKHPIIDKILDYRNLKKLLSTYIDALPLLVNKKTGKIHTSFNQTITSTGRLSSSNPNLQNIPIRDEMGKEIRKAFIAEDNCLFLSADYSQIELRIMAHLSQDENMIQDFLSGNDIHAATAAKIYKIPIEEVTPDMRRKAKTANFGIIYGISTFGLAERLNVSRKEAQELINGYFEIYPKVKQYMDKSIETARQKKYVETVLHRKRYLPDIDSKNATVRGYAERNAINSPIQGSAADIIKIAMINIFKRFEEEKLTSKMIMQVHDELNFNVAKNELPVVKKIITEEMENAYQMVVALKVECGAGKNWLEAH
ncbi:MAG: DNA polymerase I [Candidatus Azobacteroides sp.]|nr:DNA polymerase I [Candidatus Azobacteroides sp.]